MSKDSRLHMSEDRFYEQANSQDASIISNSRRRFIRNAAIGTAGAAIVTTKAERALARQTSTHVNSFFNTAKNYTLTSQSKDAFLYVGNAVLSVVNEGGDAKVSFDAIRSYLAKHLVSVSPGQLLTEVGLSRDESNVIATAYLRALAGLGSRQISENYIRQGLANPKALFDTFESSFVSQLFDKTRVEATNSSSLAQKLIDATSQFRTAADEFSGTTLSGQVTSTGGMIRPVKVTPTTPAPSLQPACNINGSPIPHWQVCVALVVVVLVVILTK